MKQPVYYISNPERIDDFVLETRLWQDDSKWWAEKRAANPAAEKHLLQLLKNYAKLTETDLAKLIKIVPPKRRSRQIVTFPFVKGILAERQLLEAILANRDEEVKRMVDRLLALIEALPTVQAVPTSNRQFVATFGNSYRAKIDCTSCSVIDLNFDNIIIDSQDNWHLIDYEWLFDFPVPKLMMIQRSLWWFVHRHQETWRYQSPKIECVALADNVLVPAVIYKAYGQYFKNYKRFFLAEKAFQEYVSGRENHKFDDFKLYAKPRPASPQLLGIDRILQHEERAEAFKAKVQRLEAENNELKAKLDKLRRHPLFKTAYVGVRVARRVRGQRSKD